MGTENRWEYRFGTLSPGAVNVGSLGQKVVGRNMHVSLCQGVTRCNPLRLFVPERRRHVERGLEIQGNDCLADGGYTV